MMLHVLVNTGAKITVWTGINLILDEALFQVDTYHRDEMKNKWRPPRMTMNNR